MSTHIPRHLAVTQDARPSTSMQMHRRRHTATRSAIEELGMKAVPRYRSIAPVNLMDRSSLLKDQPSSYRRVQYHLSTSAHHLSAQLARWLHNNIGTSQMSSIRGALSSLSVSGAPAQTSSEPSNAVNRRFSTVTDDQEHGFRKWASLLTLVLFTTATSIVSQRSRSGSSAERYSIATSILLSELLKLGVGFALAVLTRDATSSTDTASLPLFSEKNRSQDRDASLDDESSSPASPSKSSSRPVSLSSKARQAWDDIYCASAWMMGVPALVYVCQNMLQLMANSYLSSVAYQGLSQLKLVTAALISVLLFGNRLALRQWMCFPFLFGGVILLTRRPSVPSSQDLAEAVAFLREPGSESPFSHRHGNGSAAPTSNIVAKATQLAWQYSSAHFAIGTACVLLACICGGFAGVFIETKLKSSMSVDLSVRNAQLASFGLLTAGAAVVLEAINNGEWAPLVNFSKLAWITVLLRGASGYVVSATLRYADTIMKGFATSVAIITTIIVESMLSSQLPSMVQLLGSALVMISTYNYVRLGASAKA